MDEGADVNRRYFVHYVRHVAPPGALVLDYGCGDGTLVRMLRAEGYDARGVDIRWPGADVGDIERTELGRQGILRYYEAGGRLPFDDGVVDLVLSDQVFEHVVPIEDSLREIARVLAAGGITYHHFPSRSVWREGHIGIPLAHRLPPGPARLAYATALRRAGLGFHRDERPARVWATEQLAWVDRWTVYRPRREIHALFDRLGVVANREIDYCRFRAGDRWWLRLLLDRPVARGPAEALFRRLAFESIETRRPAVPVAVTPGGRRRGGRRRRPGRAPPAGG